MGSFFHLSHHSNACLSIQFICRLCMEMSTVPRPFVRPIKKCPFRRRRLSPEQKQLNGEMSSDYGFYLYPIAVFEVVSVDEQIASVRRDLKTTNSDKSAPNANLDTVFYARTVHSTRNVHSVPLSNGEYLQNIAISNAPKCHSKVL